jgi:DNA-binding HxlR family transcriptional regulator
MLKVSKGINMKTDHTCYVDTTLGIIGGKWKLVILWHLNQETLRFSELEKRIPDVTQKMLAQQLRELEKDRLISRKVYPQVPPKVEYTITEHGKSLRKVLDALGQWGEMHQKREFSALAS